MKIRIHY